MQIVLDDWQKEVLASKGHILLCTGRQVGKTMIMARKAAEYMLSHPNSAIIVVSLTEDQAELIIVFVLNYLEQNYKKEIAKGAKKPTKRKIQLKNHSFVLARPVGNTGDAVRGFTGDVLIVDEASRMPEMMWAAAKPTLATTGGEIWMCSTPFGKQGYFYKCYLNRDDRFKVFHVNTPDVYKKRVWPSEQIKEDALEFLEEERKDMSQLEFGQEYEGRFLDDLNQFFSDELIAKRMFMKRPEVIPKQSTYYLGVDIGRLGEDPSTFEVMERQGERLIHVQNQITRKTILTKTAERIFDMNSFYDFRQIFVDDEGIGIGVFDMLISDERTRRKTKGLKNSADNIRLSLKSVQYEYTTDKKGKPFMHIFGNDTHITEGLIRAAWGIKDKSLKVWVDYI
jgi:hypothetical protein